MIFSQSISYTRHARLLSIELAKKQNANVERRLQIIKNPVKGYDDAHYVAGKLTPSHLLAYKRALQVFEKYKETHYVFNHGQPGLNFVTLNVLKRVILCWDHFETSSIFTCFLRDPADLQSICKTRNVKWYKEHLTYDNHDHKFQNELISADGHLASTRFAESALSQFVAGYTNDTREKIKKQAFVNMINYHIPDSRVKEKITEEFYRLDQYLQTKGGILYTTCVPIKRFPECGYLSLPVGVAIHSRLDEHLVLKQMQEEESPREHPDYLPQVRLLAKELNAPDIKTFMFTTMEDAELEELTEKICLLRKYF